MSEQQYRLELRIPARVNGDQTAFFRMIRSRERVQVAVRKAGGLQSGGQAFGRKRATAGRESGVRLHQLLVQLAKTLFARGRILRRCGQS